MIIDKTTMNNNILVVLADDKEIAMRYGTAVRDSVSTTVMPMHHRSEIYLLYGHRGMKMVIVPGTIVKPWHKELEWHMTQGRIILQGRIKAVRVK